MSMFLPNLPVMVLPLLLFKVMADEEMLMLIAIGADVNSGEHFTDVRYTFTPQGLRAIENNAVARH